MNAILDDIGIYLPTNRVTNDDLHAEHPEWEIEATTSRVGVKQRWVAGDDETSLDLGYHACCRLFEADPSRRQRVDALIFCTQSPDYPLPPNACVLHHRLGLSENVFAFDINHACSGYIYSLSLARSMILSGSAENVLIVNADTYSKYIHKDDRSTRMLFGDGAAATWVTRGTDHRAICDISCGTFGQGFDKFIVPAGGCRLPKNAETAVPKTDQSGNVRTDENIHMSGRDILVFVSSTILRHIQKFLKSREKTVEDIDLFVFHQASRLVLDTLTRALRLDKKKVYSNLEEIGNTVSASIPIALHGALESERISSGDTVYLCGFGAGLSWGSALLQY